MAKYKKKVGAPSVKKISPNFQKQAANINKKYISITNQQLNDLKKQFNALKRQISAQNKEKLAIDRIFAKIEKRQAQEKIIKKVRNKVYYQNRKNKLLREKAQIAATELGVGFKTEIYKEDFERILKKDTPSIRIKKLKKRAKSSETYYKKSRKQFIDEQIKKLRERINKTVNSLEEVVNAIDDAIENYAEFDTVQSALNRKKSEWTNKADEMKLKASQAKDDFYRELFERSEQEYRKAINRVDEILSKASSRM